LSKLFFCDLLYGAVTAQYSVDW